MLKNEKMFCLGFLALMLGMAAWGYFKLPDVPMAVHFGADGTADGFQPRDIAVLVIPGVGFIAMLMLLWVLPPILPKATSIERSANVYGIFVVVLFAFFTLVQAMLVLMAAGVVMDHTRIIFAGVGFLFLILGNYLPKTRRNWLMGIRTPWTMSDERVWDKTQRFAGPMFMLGGAITLTGALFAPVDWRAPILVVAVLSVVFISYVYSYVAFRELR